MAAQANITEILAALAAQRPGGTPSQSQLPPQQAPPQGYAASPYSASGPPAASPYALPQPNSAGHVDLSTIKPSNAGSVSFADTLAKARGFAAERGVSYDSPRPGRSSRSKTRRAKKKRSLIYTVDARLPARPPPHQRQRSRSRSPPRVARDSFRDNYNPYRDERRDDPRRFNGPGPYTRDRSYSPGPGARQGAVFSPSGYNRGAGGEEEEDSEIIFIDSNVVGLIIGKGGENMRRIEQETSTRVQFISGPDSSAPKRQCKIKGTRAARQHAKDEINRVIEENGNPARGNLPPSRLSDANRAGGGGSHQPALRAGEDATQIMVPNRTVGLIIGRGGETIRDLQEKSQCHINIVGPEKAVNGLRPVNLIGTPANAKAAKEAIMEIVELDTKASTGGEGGRDQGGRGQGGGSNFGGFSGGGGAGGEDKINDSMTVPSGAVGMIIGKGGETIKDMQMSTGCKINVAQPVGVDHERSIGLIGTRDAIEAAKRAIMEKVYAVQEKSGDDRDRFGGGPNRRDNNSSYQDPYSQPQQPQQQYPSYGQQQNTGYQQPQQDQQQPGQQQMPQQGTADQYAPWGGYENYARMYYAYMNQQVANQQGGTPAGAGASGPPPSA